MVKKTRPKRDIKLKNFIKTGGRQGAETDFDEILKLAVKPKKYSKPVNKSK
jgi:hypothetical protein